MYFSVKYEKCEKSVRGGVRWQKVIDEMTLKTERKGEPSVLNAKYHLAQRKLWWKDRTKYDKKMPKTVII